MRAIIFDGVGGAEVLRLVDEPEPVVRPRDLLVRVRAAGVNRSDILQRQGAYGERPDFGDSAVPGLELAGEVTEVGPEAGTDTAGLPWRVGDRVMAVVGGGGYAEMARVDARMAMRVPEGLSWVEAAGIPEAFVTAHEALLHLGEAKAGEWVLIQAAASGVGSAAVQLAKAAGAKVIFTASGEERISNVKTLAGQDSVGVDYRKADFLDAVLKATGGEGVAVVVDFVGAPYLERNLKSLRKGGRLVQVGLLGGGEGKLPMELVLSRYLRIQGTVMKTRAFEEKAAMTRRFAERWLGQFVAGAEPQLRPIIARVFPLEEAAGAQRAMEASGLLGKVILETSQG